MNSNIEPFGNLKRLFDRSENYPNLNNLFNQDPYYNMLRKDIDECCEIAIRYGLVVDEKRGLLKGGRKIYKDSCLNEFRVARLFERYFGKGCLSWDPPSKGDSVGEFLLNIDNPDHIKCGIFVEVKTREEQKTTEYGTLRSNENGIISSLSKAYKKIKDGLGIPFLTVLCHDHFNIHIDEFQVIKSCFGLIDYQKGSPEVISHGYLSPDRHRNLSAIGLYYFYVNPENKELQEFFEVFYNHYATIQIDNRIFENKADRQFNLLEWSGKFTDDQTV